MGNNLKPCPFCGGQAVMYGQVFYYIVCKSCGVETAGTYSEQASIEAWNRRTPEIVKVETSFYDQEEIFLDCTVQVLTNTATGEVSVGWWKNNG